MSPLLKRHKNLGQPFWFGKDPQPRPAVEGGYRFALKGSPRFFDDVKAIVESDPGADVYFGEALTYERGAAVALWRITARSFDWLPKLYAWWAEMERVEPVETTFYLYFPDSPKYAALDLREYTPAEVQAIIENQATRA